jgi:hypothetical protein
LLFILHEEIVPKTLNQNFKEKEKLREKKKKVWPIHFAKRIFKMEAKRRTLNLCPFKLAKSLPNWQR